MLRSRRIYQVIMIRLEPRHFVVNQSVADPNIPITLISQNPLPSGVSKSMLYLTLKQY